MIYEGRRSDLASSYRLGDLCRGRSPRPVQPQWWLLDGAIGVPTLRGAWAPDSRPDELWRLAEYLSLPAQAVDFQLHDVAIA